MKNVLYFLLIMLIMASCSKSETTPYTGTPIPANDTIIVKLPSTDSVVVHLSLFPVIASSHIQITGMWNPGSLRKDTIFGVNSVFKFVIYPGSFRKYAVLVINPLDNYKTYQLILK